MVIRKIYEKYGLKMDFNELFTTIEDLESELKQYDPEVLKKLCAFLVKQYVLKEGIGFDAGIDDTAISNSANVQSKEIGNFTELIKEVQRKYNFPELRKFGIEGDKVYFVAEGRRTLVNMNENEIVESVTTVKNEIPLVNKTTPIVKKEIKKEIKTNKNDECQNRFNNLEMDE